nr:uncharacterized protein LOC111514029 [Leptinotarsa decemlineata]
MKSFCFTILTLVALAQAEDGKAKEKRGLADSYGSFSNGPSFTKSPQSSPTQQEYVSQAQQYYQENSQAPQSQAAAYTQPAVSKYSVPGLQKFVSEKPFVESFYFFGVLTNLCIKNSASKVYLRVEELLRDVTGITLGVDDYLLCRPQIKFFGYFIKGLTSSEEEKVHHE